MKSKSLLKRYCLKFMGIGFCLATFLTLAVLVYNNHLEPLAIDVAFCNFCYSIRGNKGGFIYWLFRIITEFGFVYVIVFLILIFVILTGFDYRSLLLGGGVILAAILNTAFKGLFMRPRPEESLRWVTETSSSFPSGHSSCAGYFYAFLMYLIYHTFIKKRLKIFLMLSCAIMIILVMFSRTILGVHYLSDVLAGGCIGLMVACLMMLFYKICIKHNFMTKPLFRRKRHKCS